MNGITCNAFRGEPAMEFKCKEKIAEFRGPVSRDGRVGVLGWMWEGGDTERDGGIGGGVPSECVYLCVCVHVKTLGFNSKTLQRPIWHSNFPSSVISPHSTSRKPCCAASQTKQPTPSPNS